MTSPYYQNNLGKTLRLSQASRVTSQYGDSPGNGQGGNGAYLGALADWQLVLETPRQVDDPQLGIYNIVTYLGAWTLPAETEGPDRNLSVLGRLEYGIGGTQFQVDFDWKVGNQISVAASFVRVMAAYSTSGLLLAPGEVAVGAMISSGSRASRSQATRTYPKLIVNDGEETGTVVFPVPPQAHALNIFSEDPEFYETDAVQIRFLGGANNGFSALSTSDLVSFVTDGVPFFDALSKEDGVRFPDSVKYIEVSTTTVGQDYHITPCFTLNL